MKIFINASLTKKQLRILFCTFAKKLGVQQVIFNNRGKYVCGTYNAETKRMYINTKQTKKEMLYTLFHELGHHEAVKKKRWIKYHFDLTLTITNEQIFQIENKIDQIGEKLWYKYVDTNAWGRYKYSYPKSQKHIILNYI